jgi:hypothetical protein
MSGGSFDYAYSRTAQFADDLELRLGDAAEYGPEVVGKLAQLVADARTLSRQMRAAELLFGGDIGVDTFMERMKSEPGNTAKAQEGKQGF